MKKVTLNPTKTVKKKHGKSFRLKATLVTTKGKTLVSKKIRWYSSNNKIAKVSKSGKVTCKKKGTCYIWEKAHNGKNSKKIKVKVK